MTASGQIVGTIDAVDSEADSLTYRVTEGPQFGTVQVAPDGTYTYTYTPGVGYTGTDTFTAAVDDIRVNVLAPQLGTAPTVATVKVGSMLIPDDQRSADNITIANSTGGKIKVVDLRKESGYEDYVTAAPPVGTIVEPGGSVFLRLLIAGGDTYVTYSYDTRVVFEPCNTSDCSVTAATVPWIAKLTVTGDLESVSQGVCEAGRCVSYAIRPEDPAGIGILTLLP